MVSFLQHWPTCRGSFFTRTVLPCCRVFLSRRLIEKGGNPEIGKWHHIVYDCLLQPHGSISETAFTTYHAASPQKGRWVRGAVHPAAVRTCSFNQGFSALLENPLAMTNLFSTGPSMKLLCPTKEQSLCIPQGGPKDTSGPTSTQVLFLTCPPLKETYR